MQDRFKFRSWDDYNREMLDLQEQDTNPYNISDFAQHNIMQCTGLKDKNGKLIYEGDIVKIFHVSGTMQGKLFTDVVEWNQLRCRFDTERYGVFDEDDIYEVIGNIYENPELLED